VIANRNEDIETVELSEHTVNPGEPKTGPQDFELLKLLGKGGYGKVWYLFFQHMFCCQKNDTLLRYY